MRNPPTRATARRAVAFSLLASCLIGGLTSCVGTARDEIVAKSAAGAAAEQVVSGDGGDSAEAGSSTSTTAPTTSSSTTAERGPLGSGESVTIAFAGDASFEGLGDALRSNPSGLLSAIAPVLGAADVAVVNLEAALGTEGQRVDKAFAFQVPAEALDALAAAGVDAVTMANNHGMDFGAGGLADSLRIRERSEVAVIGIGRDAEDAYSPYLTSVRGQRIGVIAANDVFDTSVIPSWTATDDQPGIASAKQPHQERLADAVRALRPRVDTLAVYLHYGVERDTCPTDRQRELVDLLTAAGADIVVGSHAHRLQGVGFHGDRLVAYGLSNFIFRSPSEVGRRSGVLTVTATGSRIDGFDWTPARIENLVPVPLSGAAAQAALDEMDQLRNCAGLSATPQRDGGD